MSLFYFTRVSIALAGAIPLRIDSEHCAKFRESVSLGRDSPWTSLTPVMELLNGRRL
jgi:hypothetical protein